MVSLNYQKSTSFSSIGASLRQKSNVYLVYSMHNRSNRRVKSFSSFLFVLRVNLHVRLDLCSQPAILPEGGVLEGGEALVGVQLWLALLLHGVCIICSKVPEGFHYIRWNLLGWKNENVKRPAMTWASQCSSPCRLQCTLPSSPPPSKCTPLSSFLLPCSLAPSPWINACWLCRLYYNWM